MKDYSNNHKEGFGFLIKALDDLTKAIVGMRDGEYKTAYLKTVRVRESIRQILEVQVNLTEFDRNESEPDSI